MNIKSWKLGPHNVNETSWATFEPLKADVNQSETSLKTFWKYGLWCTLLIYVNAERVIPCNKFTITGWTSLKTSGFKSLFIISQKLKWRNAVNIVAKILPIEKTEQLQNECYCFNANLQMFRHTLKILQHLLQYIQRVSDHFEILWIKGWSALDFRERSNF